MTMPCNLMYDVLSGGIRLIWPFPETGPFRKKRKNKNTHNHPPHPHPHSHKSNVFQGKNNSSSSSTILCAHLRQRITWFIYSLEYYKRMIFSYFILFFFHSQRLMCAERPLDQGEVWRVWWSVAASIQSPQFAEKITEAALFSAERTTDFF